MSTETVKQAINIAGQMFFAPGETDGGHSHAESVDWLRQWLPDAKETECYIVVAVSGQPVEIWEGHENHINAPFVRRWTETPDYND